MKRLSDAAIAVMKKAARDEQDRKFNDPIIDSPTNRSIEKEQRLLRKAIRSLEKLRWIDEQIFPFGRPELAPGDEPGRIGDTKPINNLIVDFNGILEGSVSRVEYREERRGSHPPGPRPEFRVLQRRMQELADAGESIPALVRHYDQHYRGKEGIPDVAPDLMIDRLKKGKNSKRSKQ